MNFSRKQETGLLFGAGRHRHGGQWGANFRITTLWEHDVSEQAIMEPHWNSTERRTGTCLKQNHRVVFHTNLILPQTAR